MQAKTKKRFLDNKTAVAVVSLLLCAVMGLTGFFGGQYILTGEAPLGLFTSNKLKSDIPKDEYGDNLFGNHAFNLESGGMAAMQGENAFFVNFEDGGKLYSQTAKGEVAQLTDFPVANLGVVGNRLVFTDLEYCVYRDASGELRYISAGSHEEIWDAVDHDIHIEYGGNLYYILGVRDYCSGALEFEDMVLIRIDEPVYYLAPILGDGGTMLATTVSFGAPSEAAGIPVEPASAKGESFGASALPVQTGGLAVTLLSANSAGDAMQIIPLSGIGASGGGSAGGGGGGGGGSGRVTGSMGLASVKPCGKLGDIEFKPGLGFSISNKVIVGNKAYIEVWSDTGVNSGAFGNENKFGENKIVAIDMETGKVLGYVEGHSLKASDTNAFFISEVNGDPEGRSAIFSFNKEGALISGTTIRVDSSDYTVDPKTSAITSQAKNPETNQLMTMYTYNNVTPGMITTTGDPLVVEAKTSILARMKLAVKEKARIILGGKGMYYDRDANMWVQETYNFLAGPRSGRWKVPRDDETYMRGWKIPVDGPRNGIPPSYLASDKLQDAFEPFCQPPAPPPTPTPKPTTPTPTTPTTPPSGQPQTPPPTTNPPSNPPAGNTSSAKPGDIMKMGGIDWRILEVKDGKALLLADEVLDGHNFDKYHGSYSEITWEECDLRKWLNGAFYNDTFSADEKALISDTKVTTKANPLYGTPGGNDTTDKLFLLSVEEVVRYFGDSGQLGNLNGNIDDEFNDARKAHYQGYTTWSFSWWLRTPGDYQRNVVFVHESGRIDMVGSSAPGGNAPNGVRPAMWVTVN